MQQINRFVASNKRRYCSGLTSGAALFKRTELIMNKQKQEIFNTEWKRYSILRTGVVKCIKVYSDTTLNSENKIEEETAMNNPISKNHRHLMEHTLGGPDPSKWFRNYFVASDGHTDLPALRELEDLGLMKEVPAPAFCPDSIVFVVTEAGKEELRKNR